MLPLYIALRQRAENLEESVKDDYLLVYDCSHCFMRSCKLHDNAEYCSQEQICTIYILDISSNAVHHFLDGY